MISDLLKNLNIFDLIFLIIMLYCIIQCFLKGFSLSFISFLKWILSVVVTIILVPKLQPWVSNYIESDFINNVGLGVFVFIFSLFFIIVVGKSLGRAITWTGMGSIDKSFGLIFWCLQRLPGISMLVYYFKLVLSLSKLGYIC